MAGLLVPSMCTSVTADRPPTYPASGDHRRPAASTKAVGLVLMRVTHEPGGRPAGSGRPAVRPCSGRRHVDDRPAAPPPGSCVVTATPAGWRGELSRWPPGWLAPWTR